MALANVVIQLTIIRNDNFRNGTKINPTKQKRNAIMRFQCDFNCFMAKILEQSFDTWFEKICNAYLSNMSLKLKYEMISLLMILMNDERYPWGFYFVGYNMSRLVGKATMWFPTRFNTNRPVQSQKRARSLKFRI